MITSLSESGKAMTLDPEMTTRAWHVPGSGLRDSTGVGVRAGAGSRPEAAEGEWARVRAQLVRLAADAIDTHTNSGGFCACCVRPWPCALAQRAEFLLGGL
jgi:hypothetical protein